MTASTEGPYDIGDVPAVVGVFIGEGGGAWDPPVTNCYLDIGGTVTTYTYGDDVEVVRDSSGHYHMDVPTTVAGRVYYRWEGLTSDDPPIPRGGGEGFFVVKKSHFLPLPASS